MSHLLSRACTMLVVIAGVGIGGCSSPSGPSAIPSSTQGPGAGVGLSSARDASSELSPSAQGKGLTDLTLAKAGWTCLTLPDRILCAPPGLGLPPIPPLPDNGGAPSYHLTAFTLDHQLLDRARFLRPDLYQGQPCLGGKPWTLFELVNYYECIDPAN